MKKKKLKIITCEKCYNIPKIVFVTRNKVHIECPNCKNTIIENLSYFDKYISSDNNNFPELPKCSYNEKHELKALQYCFKCTKYLCEKCLENHNVSFQNKSHILLQQKMENHYYCTEEGHSEYIYDRFCKKCQKYLCYLCTCNHNEDIYLFYDPSNEEKIKQVKNEVNEIETIIKED